MKLRKQPAVKQVLTLNYSIDSLISIQKADCGRNLYFFCVSAWIQMEIIACLLACLLACCCSTFAVNGEKEEEEDKENY